MTLPINRYRVPAGLLVGRPYGDRVYHLHDGRPHAHTQLETRTALCGKTVLSLWWRSRTGRLGPICRPCLDRIPGAS
jgi:hypothetical protein